MRVLLADDSELIRRRLEDILLNYDQVELIGSFSNGSEALKAMRTLQPDLSIVDNMMPGYTGLEVLHEIRKENKTMKFIVLTLYSSGFYRQKAMKEGADYFFSKADDFGKIHLVIEELLEKERKARPAKAATEEKPELKTTTKPK
jgi:DNA-binding NarL/FixJ family response regulator